MKSVAFFVKTFEGGGAQRVIANLSQELVTRNYEVCIITMYNARSYKLPDSVEIYDMSINRSDPSICANSTSLNRAMNYLKNKGVEHIIVCSTSRFLYEYALLFAQKLQFQLIAAMTNDPASSPQSKIEREKRNEVYDIIASIPYSYFIFQTEYEASYFSNAVIKKSRIINNPLKPDLIPIYSGLRKKTIVSAGRFDEQKNFQLLIRAFSAFYKTHCDYCLEIYGRGHLKKEYDNLISSLETPNIRLIPFCDDLHERIKDAAVFVQTSNYEGVSNILLEAICIGLPVIATDCPAYGARMFITDKINGKLVPVNDETALIISLEMMATKCNMEPNFDEIDAIRKYLDVKNICDQYIEIFNLYHDE